MRKFDLLCKCVLLFLFFFNQNVCSQNLIYPTGTDTSCTGGLPLYHKIYGGNKEDVGYGIVPTSDSGYVVVGYTTSFGNGGYDGLIMKLNRKGNVVWSKAVGGSGNDILYNVRKTADNGFIAVGQTKSYGNTAGDAWLVKLDATGNVQWSKKYGDGNVNGAIGADVVQLSDGGYALCGTQPYAPTAANSLVIRTDGQGNVTWSKEYGSSNSDNAFGLVEDGNFLLVVGNYILSSYYDGYIMKLDKSTGAMQWVKGYKAEGRSTWFNKISKTTNGYQVFSYITDDYNDTNNQEEIWNINTDGTVANLRKLVIPGTKTVSVGWQPLNDGGFIAANGKDNSSSDVILCRVNASGNLDWSKEYARSGKQAISGGNSIVISPEGGYAAVGYATNASTTPDSSDVYIMRVDSLGDAGGCSGVSTNDLTVVSPSYTTYTSTNIVMIGDVTANNPVITVGITSFVPITKFLCFYCQPKPTGTSAITDIQGDSENAFILKAYPNPVIGSTINVSIDALHDSKAYITIVDLSGNILYNSSMKEVKKGNNVFPLTLPHRLQAYSNYIIQANFKDFSNSKSIKIFVLNN